MTPSPCTGVCTLGDPGEGAATLCIGCGRTLDEIGAWARAPEPRRAAIAAAAAARLAALGRRTAGP